MPKMWKSILKQEGGDFMRLFIQNFPNVIRFADGDKFIKNLLTEEIRSILDNYHKNKDYDSFFEKLAEEYNNRIR